MAPDHFDLVSGAAWHDGLTDPPQQGEKAGSIQKYQPAHHVGLSDTDICVGCLDNTDLVMSAIMVAQAWPEGHSIVNIPHYERNESGLSFTQCTVSSML